MPNLDLSEKRFEHDIEAYMITDGGLVQFSWQDEHGNWIYAHQFDKEKQLYVDVLVDFIKSTQPKEWKQYSILVHALKSTSRLIGADTLSGKAAELEKAADEGRYDEIAEKHEAAMKQYLYIASVIRDNIHTEKPDDPDESVLEFYPQE